MKSAAWRIRLLLAKAVLASMCSSCTLFYCLNNDPAGIQCDFATDPEVGACLEGYTCVNGVCLKAGEGKDGDVCARDEECGSGLACATAEPIAACDDGDDVNCALLDEDQFELRCRKKCETVDDSVCAADERCYLLAEGDVAGVCQPGTCATDTECDEVDAYCSNVLPGGGLTGLCQEACDPLSCRGDGLNACAGCDGIDGERDDVFTCIPQPNTNIQAQRFVCDAYGTTPDFAPCAGAGQDLCGFGSVCVGEVGNAICQPWCSTSGNPACPPERACTSIAGGNLGLCQ
jgi:hypothetical protein